MANSLHAAIIARFDTAEVARLAKIAKLPAGSNLAAFQAGIVFAVSLYLEERAEPSAGQVQVEIKNLLKAVRRAQDSGDARDVISAIGELAPISRDWIDQQAQYLRSTGRAIDISVESVADPTNRDAALRHLSWCLSSGGKNVEGRNRPSGRRSAPKLEPVLISPMVRRGAPAKVQEQMLIMWLQVAYNDASGTMPGLSANPIMTTPFELFAASVLVRIDTPYSKGANTKKAIRRLQESRRNAMKIPKHQKMPCQ